MWCNIIHFQHVFIVISLLLWTFEQGRRSKRTRVDYGDDFDNYFKEMNVEDVGDGGRRKRDYVLYFRRTWTVYQDFVLRLVLQFSIANVMYLLFFVLTLFMEHVTLFNKLCYIITYSSCIDHVLKFVILNNVNLRYINTNCTL